jgi:hypothetical protein
VSKLSSFVMSELVRHDWKPYTGSHPVPRNSFVKNGVLFTIHPQTKIGMFHISIQKLSKVDVRLVDANELLALIEKE